MTLRYVDSSTGVDTPGGGTIGAPWKSIEYAYGQATSGDILVANGVFMGSTLGGGGTWTIASNKSIFLQSLTPYSCILVNTATFQILINAGVSTSTLGLGDVIFGGLAYGGSRIAQAIRINCADGSTITNAPNFNNLRGDLGGNGPKFVETAANALINFSFAGGAKGILNINGLIIDTPSTETNNAGAVMINSPSGLLAGSSVNLPNLYINARKNGHGNAQLSFNCLSSSIPVQIDKPNILINTTGTAINQISAISILNSDFARVSNGSIALTTEIVTANTAIGVLIDCNSGTLTANNAVQENLRITMNVGGGLGALIGHDLPQGTSPGDFRMTNCSQRDITVYGNDAFNVGGGHAVAQAFTVDSEQTNCSADNVGIGKLFKGALRGRSAGGTLTRASQSYCYDKGSTDCHFTATNIIMGGTNGYGKAMQAGENVAVNTSGSRFINNNIQIQGSVGPVIYVSPSQDVKFISNNYYDNTYTAIGAIATNGATNYSDLATALAALDTNYGTATGTIIGASTSSGSSQIMSFPL
jgi:hypothetical protein